MSTLSANIPLPALKPRVSVVIAAHNGSAFLGRCLSAICRSNCQAFEVIVVDDASTDDTVAVAEAHGARVVRMTRRGGPGAARNVGVQIANAPILFFVDADVCISSNAIDRVLECLNSRANVDAVFGSYDDVPGSLNFVSQYKNLFHRFVHQNASEEACTFWTGCGAIRRSAFDDVGGFDVQAPSIEDIDLGVRLRKAGRHIRLDKSLEATHLKTWRLGSVLKSDVIDRGIPWTRLILREQNLPTDLNLTIGQRLSALLACLMLCMTLVGSWWHPLLATLPLVAILLIWMVDRLPILPDGMIRTYRPSPVVWCGAALLAAYTACVFIASRRWGVAIGAAVVAVVSLNLQFYRFFAAARGLPFALLIVPLHLGYFIYSVVSLVTGTLLHALGVENNPQKWTRLGSVNIAAKQPERKLFSWLEQPATRRRIYGCVAGILFLLAWGAQGVKSRQSHEALDFVVSDAEGYWVYLPSLVIDHNLQMTRHIAFHETVHPIESGSFEQTPAGLHNHWPIGVALTLAPSFLLAHAACLVLTHWTGAAIFAPNGYSLLYQLFGLSTVMCISWLGMIAIDNALQRRLHLSGTSIGLGVLACMAGSNWAYYIFREPFMSHAFGAAWVILAIWSAQRLVEAVSRRSATVWHGAAFIFTISMALACRDTNVVLLPLAVWVGLVVWRAGSLTAWTRRSPVLLLAAFPLGVHLLILRIMSARQPAGKGLAGYGAHETFNWLHPVLFKTLFSDLHGLFFWSPVLLLAVFGFGRYFARPAGRRDGLIISLLISFAALWYLNSAWYAWSFGKSFGARAFLDLIGVFVIGVALAFESLRRVPARRVPAVVIPIAAAILMNWILLFLFVTNRIPRETPLFPSLYGRNSL